MAFVAAPMWGSRCQHRAGRAACHRRGADRTHGRWPYVSRATAYVHLPVGHGPVVATPAYQALVPDLVPRQQIPAAAVLNAISVNTSRAIGPAIAGLLVARVGVTAVFAVNAASFAVFGAVVAVHPRLGHRPDLPGRFLPALRSGGRYVRHAPVVRRNLVRVMYTVAKDSEPQLLEAIGELRLSRERTGAIHWDLYHGAETSNTFMELFTVPTWDEHLRQHHDRVTGVDEQFRDAAAKFSDPPPLVEHYLAADLPGPP